MPTKAGYCAIVGLPNTGKSTLLNSIIGAKLSIATPKAQTTRKRVTGIYTEGNTQIVFIDTPGLLKPKYELHRAMKQYILLSLDEADIVCVIADASNAKTINEYFKQDLLNLLKGTSKPLIALLNKSDLFPEKKELLPIMSRFIDTGIYKSVIPISALNNVNIDAISKELEKYLPEGPFFFDEEYLSSQNERFFVSELIREHIFYEFRDEVPYSTEVQIDRFIEREEGKWFVSAEIIVERDTQKAIIIGAGGSKIKEIGEKARLAIEQHLETEVYLELFVKVRNKWRNDKTYLRSYGY